MNAIRALHAFDSARLLAMYLLLLFLWALSTRFLSGAFWQALVALAAVIIPLALYGLYEAAIAKTLRRERYLREGLFFRLFSGRLLLGTFTLALVFLAGPFLLLRLHILSVWEWILLAALVPLQLAAFHLLSRRLQREYKPWLLVSAALDWTRFLCPTLIALAYIPFLLWQHAPGSGVELGVALATSRAEVADIDSSHALAYLAQFLAVLEGIKVYVLGNASSGSGRLVFWASVLDFWMVCYFLCRVLSAAILPRAEWRRVFGPLWDEKQAPPLTPMRVGIAAALGTFVILFVGVPVVSSVETQVRTHPELQQALVGMRLRVESIDSDYFAPGTIAAIERSRRVALSRLDVSTADLHEKTVAAFAAMAGNVDVYLDWYYSLGAEYMRIGHLLAGDLENYMAQKFAETLAQGDSLRAVESALAASLESSAEASNLYERLVAALMDQNRIDDTSGYQVEVTRTIALADVLVLPEHQELLGVQNRLLASGGGAVAGVVGGVIAGKLAAKVVTKSTFKLAAKSLGKFAATKAAGSSLGAGAGAATGGAIGSVVPGLGTALGALVGGVIGGLAVGIGIDYALIEFEEAVGRDAFRAELLAVLEEARREYLETPVVAP